VTAGEHTQVEHLRIEVRREPDRIVVSLHGELDLASAPLLQSELESTETGETALLVLDTDDLEFIDSTGLRIILAAHERAQERGQQFALTRGSQQVQRLLNITRVDERLRIVDSPDELLV
jgi:anti-sigma B factor antagonist